MINLSVNEVTPKLRNLFNPSTPAAVRCFLVLNGTLGGQILTDNPMNPTWAVVRESAYGATFLGGSFTASLLSEIIELLRQNGDVCLLLLPDDKHLKMLPSPQYEGYAIDFTDRPIGEGLDHYLIVPDDCQIYRIDRDLFERSADRDMNIATFGTVESALENWVGFFLMNGNEILCEASAGPSAMGIVELGVATSEFHRQKGYATVTCAYLIRACESMGYHTYWNTAAQNLASISLARKLGYTKEVEHKVLAWFKPE